MNTTCIHAPDNVRWHGKHADFLHPEVVIKADASIKEDAVNIEADIKQEVLTVADEAIILTIDHLEDAFLLHHIILLLLHSQHTEAVAVEDVQEVGAHTAADIVLMDVAVRILAVEDVVMLQDAVEDINRRINRNPFMPMNITKNILQQKRKSTMRVKHNGMNHRKKKRQDHLNNHSPRINIGWTTSIFEIQRKCARRMKLQPLPMKRPIRRPRMSTPCQDKLQIPSHIR